MLYSIIAKMTWWIMSIEGLLNSQLVEWWSFLLWRIHFMSSLSMQSIGLNTKIDSMYDGRYFRYSIFNTSIFNYIFNFVIALVDFKLIWFFFPPSQQLLEVVVEVAVVPEVADVVEVAEDHVDDNVLRGNGVFKCGTVCALVCIQRVHSFLCALSVMVSQYYNKKRLFLYGVFVCAVLTFHFSLQTTWITCTWIF